MAYPKSLFINRMAVVDESGRYRTATQQFCGTRSGNRNKYTKEKAGKSKARFVRFDGWNWVSDPNYA